VEEVCSDSYYHGGRSASEGGARVVVVVGGGGGGSCNESNVDDGSLTYLCASLMMMNREMLPSICARRVERQTRVSMYVHPRDNGMPIPLEFNFPVGVKMSASVIRNSPNAYVIHPINECQGK